MPKARIIRMDHIRVERNRRLDEIDKVINTKVDSGLDVTALRVVRQKLRDIPQTTDLTVATTPEALAALEPSWPANP
jgi:Fe-S cluster assembly ATPase SufC